MQGSESNFAAMQPDPANSMPAPVQINTEADSKAEGEEAKIGEQPANTALVHQQQLMNTNLCEKHFPEPVLYMSDQPLCRKCVPEYMEKKNKNKKRGEGSEQSQMIAKMLGFN